MDGLRGLLASGCADFRWLVGFLDARTGPKGLSEDQVEEVLTWAVQHLRVVRGLAEKTVAKYVRHLVSYLEYLGKSGVAVEDASVAHIEGWQKELFMVNKYCPTWRRNHLVAVRQFYAWLVQMGKTTHNPAASVRGPKPERRMPRKYTEDEMRRLFVAVGKTTPREKRDRAFLAVLYATGARREEMATLSLDQIELQQHVARLRIMGKGSKERVVSFEGAPVRALREWLVVRDGLAPLPEPSAVWIALRSEVVPGGRMKLHSLGQMFRAICTRAHIKRQSLHAVRVTYATDLYDQGEDLERIRVLLGHEGIETTRRYIAISKRSQTTRLSGRRVSELMGEREDAEPLWLRRRLEHRGEESRD